VRQPVVAPAQEESVSASVAIVETDGERLLTGERLLSRAEVCDRVGRTFPIIWNMMREGRFPRARSTSPSGGPLWLESEVIAWMRALPVKPYKGDAEAAPAAEPSVEANRRAAAKTRRDNVRARARTTPPRKGEKLG
jgi:predicted DNA-binding transcriptional regulator AlpA